MDEIKKTIVNIIFILFICAGGFVGGYYFANKQSAKSIEAERLEYSKSKLQFELRISQYQKQIDNLTKQQFDAIANISSGTTTMAGYSCIIGTETIRILSILEEVRGSSKTVENGGNS